MNQEQRQEWRNALTMGLVGVAAILLTIQIGVLLLTDTIGNTFGYAALTLAASTILFWAYKNDAYIYTLMLFWAAMGISYYLQLNPLGLLTAAVLGFFFSLLLIILLGEPSEWDETEL